MSEVMTIAVEDIRVPDNTLRKVNKNTDEYRGMKDSIRTKGLINAISVRANPEITEDKPEPYVLIDGGHRHAAFLELFAEHGEPFDSINATVVEVDDVEALVLQVAGNTHRLATKPVEYANQLNLILAKDPDMTQTKLAKRLNMTPSWISQILKTRHLSEEAKKELGEDVKLNTAVVISRIKALRPEEEMDWVAKAKSMSQADFAKEANDHLKVIKKLGNPKKDVWVMHDPRPRKKEELLDLFAKNPKAKVDIAWVLCQDQESINASKAKFAERQEKKMATKVLNHLRKVCKREKIETKGRDYGDLTAELKKVKPQEFKAFTVAEKKIRAGEEVELPKKEAEKKKEEAAPAAK